MSDFIKDLINKQIDYCNMNDIPCFIPEDGVCWSCKKQIFGDKKLQERVSFELITSCPFCNNSFID